MEKNTKRSTNVSNKKSGTSNSKKNQKMEVIYNIQEK